MTAPRRRAATAFILVTVFLDVLGFGIILPVLPHLLGEMMHEDAVGAATTYGLLSATYALMQLLFAPLLGALSDRVGRRPLLLFSLAGMGVGYLLMATATSLPWLFAARCLSGITGASFSTAYAYIADVTPPEKRAQSYGLSGAAFGLGFVFGPALGGTLGHLGIRLPFYAAAAIVAANLLYGLLVLPESLPAEHRRPLDLRRATPLGGLLGLRRFPLVAGLALVFVFASLSQRGMESIWVLYTDHRYGWRELETGLGMTVVGLSSALVQGGLVQRLGPRLGERRMALLGIGVSLGTMVLYGLASRGWMMMLLVVLGSLGAMSIPSIQALVSRSVPPDEQGSIQGVFTSLLSLTSLVAPLVHSQLFGWFSRKNAPLYLPGVPFFAGALFLGAALLLLLRIFRRLPEVSRT